MNIGLCVMCISGFQPGLNFRVEIGQVKSFSFFIHEYSDVDICLKVCMAHADKTGGLMELGEVKHKLIKSRGRSAVHQVRQG